MFFIVIDAHSKWPEVIPMTSTTAGCTIRELRKLFAAHGLPEQIVSDNGSQFTSAEFASFMKANGIKHIQCSPYHPSSNGAAERPLKEPLRLGRHQDDPLIRDWPVSSSHTVQHHMLLRGRCLVNFSWDESYVLVWTS